MLFSCFIRQHYCCFLGIFGFIFYFQELCRDFIDFNAGNTKVKTTTPLMTEMQMQITGPTLCVANIVMVLV